MLLHHLNALDHIFINVIQTMFISEKILYNNFSIDFDFHTLKKVIFCYYYYIHLPISYN